MEFSGVKLEKAMKAKGIGETALAYACGVRERTVANWRAGCVPSGERLVLISRALSIAPDELMDTAE